MLRINAVAQHMSAIPVTGRDTLLQFGIAALLGEDLLPRKIARDFVTHDVRPRIQCGQRHGFRIEDDALVIGRVACSFRSSRNIEVGNDGVRGRINRARRNDAGGNLARRFRIDNGWPCLDENFENRIPRAGYPSALPRQERLGSPGESLM
jgi:hypothetical protein